MKWIAEGDYIAFSGCLGNNRRKRNYALELTINYFCCITAIKTVLWLPQCKMERTQQANKLKAFSRECWLGHPSVNPKYLERSLQQVEA